MKFTINAKELYKMVDSVKGVAPKKSCLKMLQQVFIRMNKELKTVDVFATDFEQWAWAYTHDVDFLDDIYGVVGINPDAINIFKAFTGDVTVDVERCYDNLELGIIHVYDTTIKLSIPCVIYDYENENLKIPENISKCVNFTCFENWLKETISNLAKFTAKSSSNKMCQVINFNTMEYRVEACDGYRIGTRTMFSKDVNIYSKDNVKLNAKYVPAIKKLLNNSNDDEVCIDQGDKYIFITSIRTQGFNFVYICKTEEGMYFNVSQTINCNYSNNFYPDAEKLLTVAKAAAKVVGKNIIPMMIYNKYKLHNDCTDLQTYTKVNGVENVNNFYIKAAHMPEDFYIGIKPIYLVDALSICDADKVEIRLNGSNSPIIIEDNEYIFLCLPIRPATGIVDSMLKLFREK